MPKVSTDVCRKRPNIGLRGSMGRGPTWAIGASFAVGTAPPRCHGDESGHRETTSGGPIPQDIYTEIRQRQSPWYVVRAWARVRRQSNGRQTATNHRIKRR
ncbi:hypothetical protein EVAR_64927_1 [Eumeta japonica]|uniref:Uncharacterized protein n=1 Tax=Eumeta variegata TaxID=151549 RepID=A0A4C2A557_EUMVA|nr:hypothetical protein EVAR_64927_1 [Eumeta japonica]